MKSAKRMRLELSTYVLESLQTPRQTLCVGGEYLNDRILFYDTADPKALERVDTDTAQLQVKLWNAVRSPALATPTPMMALVVSGMNDVLNAQRFTQAAYWDRIPPGAWTLMAAIAIFVNMMIGYSSRREKQ